MEAVTAPVTATSLHYTLRFRDYWAFHCLSQLFSPVTQLALMLCSAAFGHWVWSEGGGVGLALAVALAAYAAFWLLQCIFNAIYLKSRNNRALLAAHSVTIQPDGLRDSTDAGWWIGAWWWRSTPAGWMRWCCPAQHLRAHRTLNNGWQRCAPLQAQAFDWLQARTR